MTLISRREFSVLLASAAVMAAVPVVTPAWAQGDPAVAAVQGFYDALVAQMKKGGPIRARYAMLKPVVEKSFDLPGMTEAAVGPGFAALAESDKKALTDAFERLTVATYVRNFDSYHGEQFIVDPATMPIPPSGKRVNSTLKSGKDTRPFGYRVYQLGSEWKILDIYLNGSISQLGQLRSEYAATFTAGGAAGLTKALNAKADQQLGS